MNELTAVPPAVAGDRDEYDGDDGKGQDEQWENGEGKAEGRVLHERRRQHYVIWKWWRWRKNLYYGNTLRYEAIGKSDEKRLERAMASEESDRGGRKWDEARRAINGQEAHTHTLAEAAIHIRRVNRSKLFNDDGELHKEYGVIRRRVCEGIWNHSEYPWIIGRL